MVGDDGAGGGHAVQGVLAVLLAAAADGVPAEVHLVARRQQFQHGLQDANMGLDAPDNDLALPGWQAGPGLLEQRLET